VIKARLFFSKFMIFFSFWQSCQPTDAHKIK
jgi:hypothetical protein